MSRFYEVMVSLCSALVSLHLESLSNFGELKKNTEGGRGVIWLQTDFYEVRQKQINIFSLEKRWFIGWPSSNI